MRSGYWAHLLYPLYPPTRLLTQVRHGCIPVIIMDGVLMPFEGVLDYASFSIRIPEADVEQLDALLRAVPAARKVSEFVRERVRTRASRPAASALHGPFLASFLPYFLSSLRPSVLPFFLARVQSPYNLPCSPGGDARGDGHPVDTLHLRKVNPAARRMAAQARAAARLP